MYLVTDPLDNIYSVPSIYYLRCNQSKRFATNQLHSYRGINIIFEYSHLLRHSFQNRTSAFYEPLGPIHPFIFRRRIRGSRRHTMASFSRGTPHHYKGLATMAIEPRIQHNDSVRSAHVEPWVPVEVVH